MRDLETFLHGHLPATDASTGLVLILTDREGRIDRVARARQALAATAIIGVRAAAILARMAAALGDRGVNIAGIVGIAEDTNGELMLETSDAEATRAAFDALGLSYDAHDADGGMDPGRMSIADITTR